MITLDDLLREGEALARSCFLLDGTDGARLAGYWGGERMDGATRPRGTAIVSAEHTLTLDPALLREAGVGVGPGPLSLYEVTGADDEARSRLVTSPDTLFAEVRCSGEPLFATAAKSFPPLPALCLNGGSKVAEWLATLGLVRHQYDSVAAAPLAREYEDAWLERSHFHDGEADIIVGGWHQLWPDDDFFLPLEMRLVATTLRDAEPWREIWLSESGNLSVRDRLS